MAVAFFYGKFSLNSRKISPLRIFFRISIIEFASKLLLQKIHLPHMQFNEELTDLIIQAIQGKKGERIAIINLSGLEMASSAGFIVCQGRSTSNVSAIADSVREYVQEHSGRKPYNYEGYRNSQWIVIDYGEVMVHIFLPDTRATYNIEELWADAPVRYIPD